MSKYDLDRFENGEIYINSYDELLLCVFENRFWGKFVYINNANWDDFLSFREYIHNALDFYTDKALENFEAIPFIYSVESLCASEKLYAPFNFNKIECFAEILEAVKKFRQKYLGE